MTEIVCSRRVSPASPAPGVIISLMIRGRDACRIVGFVEAWLYEFAAIEQGGDTAEPRIDEPGARPGRFPAFRGASVRMASGPGFPYGTGAVLASRRRRTGRQDADAGARQRYCCPDPVGLERDGATLIKPYCPPYYRSMEEAVLAFVDYKYAHGRGTLRDGGAATGWEDAAAVQAGIPPVLGPSHRRDDRSLRLPISAVWAFSSRQRSIPHGAGLPSSSSRSGILPAVLSS